ncbi:hypothetical protein NYE40_22740 [Paenibacillus sp. FSL W8-1187]|uniref:hypothetical protein n=1 Tax=Paenibacillus sp. FSL W8-1187 TaxID=2975339 RepID=UPI0030D86F7D
MNEEEIKKIIENLGKSSSATSDVAGQIKFSVVSLDNIANEIDQLNSNATILIYFLGAITLLLGIMLVKSFFNK